jgi:hypothetical protein
VTGRLALSAALPDQFIRASALVHLRREDCVA